MPSHPSRRTRRAVALAAAGTLSLGFLLVAPSYGAASTRAVIADTVPTWVATSSSRGTMSLGQSLAIRVYLASRDPQGLASYARAVSTAGTADYHHYLIAAEPRHGSAGRGCGHRRRRLAARPGRP